MKWFHKNRKKIFLSVIAIFVIGSFAGFGSYFFAQSPFDAAIVVNDRKIPYKRFDNLYQRVLEDQRERSASPLTDPQRAFLRQQVVQALVQEEVFLAEAEGLGIRVTDRELAQMIQAVPEFQKDGRFDIAAYQQVLGRMRMKVEDFEEAQRSQVMVQQAQYFMASGVRISSLEFPAQLKAALDQSKPEERKALLENLAEFREKLRSREIQASLQHWYTDLNSRLKVKVLLNKIEGTPVPSPTPAPTPAP